MEKNKLTFWLIRIREEGKQEPTSVEDKIINSLSESVKVKTHKRQVSNPLQAQTKILKTSYSQNLQVWVKKESNNKNTRDK